jgi:hypothetical protein
VPELWQDLLLKIKAAGFNAFSLYAHWGYHNSSPGVLDFSSGAHDLTPILTYAKDIGLYVLFRLGPYVNAQANAGGLPLGLQLVRIVPFGTMILVIHGPGSHTSPSSVKLLALDYRRR